MGDSEEISIVDGRFRDKHGRTLFLPGINLSGISKMPVSPDGATYKPDAYQDGITVSFVGRPFPLESADEHFSRLRSWGYKLLRFIVTWEAVEHAGPGKYDSDYLMYLRQMLDKARTFGFKCFVDPHQDVWSRRTGGDGAPTWTLEAAGFEPSNLHATMAAYLHNEVEDKSMFGPSSWILGHSLLAVSTMFTLFFAGKTFAPKLMVKDPSTSEEVNIQDFLQGHYIRAICKIAEAVKDTGCVIGYDTLNEPSAGYIGCADLTKYQSLVPAGPQPTAFEGFLLGSGRSVPVRFHKADRPPLKTETQSGNPKKLRAWREGCRDIWVQHGVWDDEEGKLLKPDYFAKHPETLEPISFYRDFFNPFATSFASAIHQVHPEAFIFVELMIMQESDMVRLTDEQISTMGGIEKLVFAPHWYDYYMMVYQRFRDAFEYDTYGILTGTYGTGDDAHIKALICGRKNLRKHRVDKILKLKTAGQVAIGNVPVVVGECGIIYDLVRSQAFSNGDYSLQAAALNEYLSGLEELVPGGCCLWNYCPINTHSHGDQWNSENLSPYTTSLSDSWPHDPSLSLTPAQTSLLKGGRALVGFIRPHATHVAGRPLENRFDLRTVRYRLRHVRDDDVTLGVSIVRLPLVHVWWAGVKRGGLWRWRVEVSDGEVKREGPGEEGLWEVVTWTHDVRSEEHLLVAFLEPLSSQ